MPCAQPMRSSGHSSLFAALCKPVAEARGRERVAALGGEEGELIRLRMPRHLGDLARLAVRLSAFTYEPVYEPLYKPLQRLPQPL